MKYSENVLNVLAALKCSRIGSAWIVKNYIPNMQEEELANKLNIDIDVLCEKKEEVKRKLDDLSEFVDGFVAFGDDDFPFVNIQNSNLFFNNNAPNRNTQKLKDSETPVFLSYKGDLKLLSANNINIAVIGVLNPIPQIEELEKNIVTKLVKNEAVIVSGLALGCDTIGHKVALKNNMPTIAILPSTLADIVPAQNSDLAEEITLNGGLLISEYYEKANSLKEQVSRFINRDRLQALFSDMVLLTASYSADDTMKNKKLDSGSRHAMNKAREYGIRTAVMYEKEIFSHDQFNLNKEYMQGIDIEIINSTNKNFKVFTQENSELIFRKFKEYKLANI